MTVIVGVDGSLQSRHALMWGVEEARLRGDHVVALMAYSPPPAYYPSGLPGSGNIELDHRIEKTARSALSKIVEEIGSSSEAVKIKAEVVEHSQPARALTQRAGVGDILVVGSRGHGGFTGLLLGSVSQQCVQHAQCPVVVLPRRKED